MQNPAVVWIWGPASSGMPRSYDVNSELKGHTLLAHGEEDFQEQGQALSFFWGANPSDRGPSLSISYAIGTPSSVAWMPY